MRNQMTQISCHFHYILWLRDQKKWVLVKKAQNLSHCNQSSKMKNPVKDDENGNKADDDNKMMRKWFKKQRLIKWETSHKKIGTSCTRNFCWQMPFLKKAKSRFSIILRYLIISNITWKALKSHMSLSSTLTCFEQYPIQKTEEWLCLLSKDIIVQQRCFISCVPPKMTPEKG